MENNISKTFELKTSFAFIFNSLVLILCIVLIEYLSDGLKKIDYYAMLITVALFTPFTLYFKKKLFLNVSESSISTIFPSVFIKREFLKVTEKKILKNVGVLKLERNKRYQNIYPFLYEDSIKLIELLKRDNCCVNKQEHQKLYLCKQHMMSCLTYLNIFFATFLSMLANTMGDFTKSFCVAIVVAFLGACLFYLLFRHFLFLDITRRQINGVIGFKINAAPVERREIKTIKRKVFLYVFDVIEIFCSNGKTSRIYLFLFSEKEEIWERLKDIKENEYS